MSTPVIIPARMGSKRFPGKPLAEILGKPMIQWVCELSSEAVGRDNVYVATDSEQLCSLVSAKGFNAMLTSETCLTGTDRVADAMRMLSTNRAVNVQGDEPLLSPSLIEDVVRRLEVNSGEVICAASEVTSLDERFSTSIPKMVFSKSGKLLYASRSVIPGSKSDRGNLEQLIHKQVCVYGFHLAAMEIFGSNSHKGRLETFEDIEIIRFLEHDVSVEVLVTDSISVSVDFPEDIAKAEAELIVRQNA